MTSDVVQQLKMFKVLRLTGSFRFCHSLCLAPRSEATHSAQAHAPEDPSRRTGPSAELSFFLEEGDSRGQDKLETDPASSATPSTILGIGAMFDQSPSKKFYALPR